MQKILEKQSITSHKKKRQSATCYYRVVDNLIQKISSRKRRRGSSRQAIGHREGIYPLWKQIQLWLSTRLRFPKNSLGSSESVAPSTQDVASKPVRRKYSLWILVRLGLGVCAIVVVTSAGSIKPILLPEDLGIQRVIMEHVEPLSDDFHGQGSSDILPAFSPFVPTVNQASYTVKEGDTLSAIAPMHGVSVATLIGFNSITDVYAILPGTELLIPDADGISYLVQEGDSPASIAASHNVSVNSIVDANDLESVNLNIGQRLFIPGARISDYEYKMAMGTLFVFPSVGRLTSGFGYRPDPFTGERRFHYAIDVANNVGTPVIASKEGKVIAVMDSKTGYGRSILLRHSNGYQTLYAHLSKILVGRGERVVQGEKIALMGNTGRSTGPHLHFAIYRNGIPVNPMSYLHQ